MKSREEQRKYHQAVIEDLMETCSHSQTARNFGVTREWVRQITTQYGYDGKKLMAMRLLQKRELIEGYIAKGLTAKEVAEAMGHSVSTIYNLAYRLKIDIPHVKCKEELSERVGSHGYRYVKVGRKWVMKSRWIMEQKLGRKLIEEERVFHKNGDNTDDSSDNLEVRKVFARGTIKTETGHVLVFDKRKKGYRSRSRKVMEQMIKRKLKTQERIFHKDGNVANDSPDNLWLCGSVAEYKSLKKHFKKIWKRRAKERYNKEDGKETTEIRVAGEPERATALATS